MSDLLRPSTGDVDYGSTRHPDIPEPPFNWLVSPDDIPLYSTDLIRKRHWLERLSTNFVPESSNLSEEERYINFWSDNP